MLIKMEKWKLVLMIYFLNILSPSHASPIVQVKQWVRSGLFNKSGSPEVAEVAENTNENRTPEHMMAGCSEGICLTKGCDTAAADILENLDDTVEPCDDFFKFACGGFLKKKVIPEDKKSIFKFTEILDGLKDKLRSIAEVDISNDDSPSSLLVKNLYKSCMNTGYIEQQGLQPLKEVLHEMGGWPVVDGDNWDESKFEWNQNIYTNRKLGYSIDHFFGFSVGTDIKNSTTRIIYIDQPRLGIPREYLVEGFNDSSVQAYYQYQVSFAELLGANRTQAESELKESIEFEIQIANLSLSREERQNITRMYNPMTIEDLQAMVPGIPWLEYINTVLNPYVTVQPDELVVVAVPNYIKNIDILLKTTPKRTLANFLLWHVAADSAEYLSEDVRALELEFYKNLDGQAKRETRWKECIEYSSRSLTIAIGSMYAATFFNESAKAAADEMVLYIRAQFDLILQNIDWMDDLTRERAINKLKAIKAYIAYPSELLDQNKLSEFYDGLELNDGHLLENMRNLSVFGADYSFRHLRESINKTDWRNHGNAAVVNAFYNPLGNSIEFPAGILQGVFFDVARPKYLNFGGIGFVIGHEITHGFDNMGRQFDSNGDWRDWWEEETEDEFLEKAKCIIDQYSNYYEPDVGLYLNGVVGQGENIADNGGVKLAYYAYNQWAEDHGEECGLSGLPYTSKQLFWLSSANVWCGKYRPEELKRRILTGYHAPAQFRINGPLSNLPEFSKDWNCPINTTMNPMNKCSVW